MIYRIGFMALMVYCTCRLAIENQLSNPDAFVLCGVAFICGTMFALKPMSDMVGEAIRIAEWYRDKEPT